MSGLAALRSQRFYERQADRTDAKLREGSSEPQAAATVTVRASRRYRAAAESVFDAWLKPEIAVDWLFATATRPLASAEIDARVGGRFRFVEAGGPIANEWTGKYVAIQRCRRLVFTLSGSFVAGSTVTISIVELERGCRLSLTHDGLPRARAQPAKQRWIGILYGLGATLDAAAVSDAPEAPAQPLFARGPWTGAIRRLASVNR
ncbi:MAG TPA: SRPBCC family protein [Casimicrobiaceae bacterium]|nr:SRPBCC family protein [Casimicrobiaceae bacterium]